MFHRLTNKVLPQLLVAHSLYVVGLYAGKEWVLGLDTGVPWLLIRVLALGGLGFVVWEVKYGKLFASKAIEVRSLRSYSDACGLSLPLNFWNVVVRCRDGFSVRAFTACVAVCCIGCFAAHKVRFRPFPSGLVYQHVYGHDRIRISHSLSQSDRLYPVFDRLAKSAYGQVFSTFDLAALKTTKC